VKKSNVLKLSMLAVLAGASTAALADGAPTPDGTLTMYGVTLYGTLDAGIQYQSAGAAQSAYWGTGGSQEIIGKTSHSSEVNVGGSYLSQSVIGLKGQEDFGNDWSGVFKAEMQFNPWSGQLPDALKGMTLNNGKGVAQQSANSDSSIAGQLFAGQANFGVSHKTLGTLTFGRHLGVLADGISKYDPMGGSQAFSPIGFSGTAAGGGDTEDKRLDSSVKYEVVAGGVHVAAQFQPTTATNPGTTSEFALGWQFPGGSVDAYYMQKSDAISASALSAAQVTALGAVATSGASIGQPLCTSPTAAVLNTATAQPACAALNKALAATITDNTTIGLMGQYTFNKQWKLSAGYEQIKFQNPSNFVQPGQETIGGYTLVVVTNGIGTVGTTKQLDISWIGAKYSPTPKVDLLAAFYQYDQNSFATGSGTTASKTTGVKYYTGAGCSTEYSSKCSGKEYFVSLVGVYHATKRFDVYAGALWSAVQGGLANGYTPETSATSAQVAGTGYANATSTIDPTIGFRYKF